MKKKLIVIIGIIFIMGIIVISIGPVHNYLLLTKYKSIGYNHDQIQLIQEKVPVDNRNILLENGYLDYLEDLLLNDIYNKNNFVDYIQYIKDNSLKKEQIEDIVFLVNQGITNSYSSRLVEIVQSPYFIKKRLNRYLEYMTSRDIEDILLVVQSVNCNLDLDNYHEKADITKESLMLVNSFYSLDKNYTTELVLMEEGYSNYSDSRLNFEAYEHFKKLVDDSEREGYHIRNNSSYRSYLQQEELYNQYLQDYGIEYTEKYVSKPGYSEHQTGYALDVGVLKKFSSTKFENTKEFLWMRDNSYKYGFILRYPKEGRKLFGYGYEPWHYRYVGVDAATYIHEHNITFEEYYSYFVEN